MSMRMRTLFITSAAIGTLALAGCGASSSSSPTPTGSPSGTVTLVTHDSYAISDSVLADFTKQTGVTVKINKTGDAAAMVNRAILTKGSPEGDALFGIDNNLLSRGLDSGLFQSYQPSAASQIPQTYQLDPSHTVTPIDHADVCVNYDKTYFTSHNLTVPQTLDDLTKSEYKNLLVVQNPSTSTPGLAFMLATVAKYGQDGFANYWQSLKNNGVKVENSWSVAYDKQFSGGSGKGPYPLVVSYDTSPPASVVYAQNPPKDGIATTGVLTDTCYGQVEFAGVLANAKNPRAAQAFIDFMLTKQYQADLPLQQFVFPVMPDTPLPEVFTKNVTSPEHPFVLPATEVNTNRDAWVQTWTNTVQH